MNIKKVYEVNVTIEYEDKERDKESYFDNWLDSSTYTIRKEYPNGKPYIATLRPNLSIQTLEEIIEQMITVLEEAKDQLNSKGTDLIDGIVSRSLEQKTQKQNTHEK